MDFGFSEEQDLLRAEVRKFLDQNASMEEVRRIAESPDESFDRTLWQRMAELGWVGLALPEEHGGMGLGFVTLLPVLEECGRSLFPSPLLSTLVAAKAIERAGSQAQRERWLPQLADGSRIATLALLEESDSFEPDGIRLRAEVAGEHTLLSGRKLFVSDAAAADLFAVAYRSGPRPEELSLAVVERDAAGLSVIDYPTTDLTKSTGELVLDAVQVGPGEILGDAGSAWPTLAWLVDLGAVLVTAESVGAAEGAHHLTTEFVKERIQFGAPIGKFQGVKHPLAEMFVDIESFKSLVYYAAWAVDEGAEDLSLAASRAKAYASEAFARIGIDGVQLHGGVGFTWEYDIQMYLKRSKWARPAFGDADYHYGRLATLGGM
jgi:alkylation response protein AidB-like acyl-CoA dehydrogenase